MFPKKITGYEQGKVLTAGELKALLENTIIHLYYTDKDDELRTDSFKRLSSFKNNCANTADGYSMPLEGLNDNDLVMV